MTLLKERSAQALNEALTSLGADRFTASDRMDDGSPIVVRCEASQGGLVVDFTGSASVHPGNLNATPAIVHSAVIYVLRLLAGRDLPLNEGLLRNVGITIPPGILSPEFSADPERCPAVVGGNVETSQRVVDVLLQALNLAACSQGTMNNITFGNGRFSCYETIGGGAGGTAAAEGCSAVHVHMTNTAITDPEVMEARMPVRVERFAIRHGSGGVGRHRGGDGIERRIRFLEPVELSLLTQRRLHGPPGLGKGKAGKPGRQSLIRRRGSEEELTFNAATTADSNEVLVMETPGGGGWG
jgi:5-oxoprolinase (ATP-hydrolysing)